jgi:hypothetical protein
MPSKTERTVLLCKKCRSTVAQEVSCPSELFVPRKGYFNKIDSHVRETSVPRLVSTTDPPAYVVVANQLHSNIKPTTEGLFKSITCTDIFNQNHIQPPQINNQTETSVWIPQDGICYVPL